jgi:hypothetical protein
MVSGTTLSGQPENIRGVEVVRATGNCHVRIGPVEKFLKRCPTTEPSFHVMPPLEFIALAQLPTKKHDAAVSKRWEINQAAVKIL